MPPLRVGVLASGSGSNLQALIDACEAGAAAAEVVAVATDRPTAFALERAAAHGVPGLFVDPAGLEREAHERRVAAFLDGHGVELVCLAGYMRIVSPWFVRHYEGRLMNVHPALLPSFKGLNGQRQALEYGAKVAGCTVHFVDEEVDHGPIILQAAVPVLEGDTEASLSRRILRKEHEIYPKAVHLFAQGRLSVEGRRVRIKGADDAAAAESEGLTSPRVHLGSPDGT